MSAKGKKRDGMSLLATPIASRVGGHTALDFCNTAGEHLSDQPLEKIVDWEAFVRWATQAGLISEDDYLWLVQTPEPLGAVIRLREAIYSVAVAVARGIAVPGEDLEEIQRQASGSKPSAVIVGGQIRREIQRDHASRQLRSILATEALSLFCSPRGTRIGICDGGNCGWVFIDESRGKRRRWCDMNDCGNRAKARRYYQEHKSK